MKLAVFVFYILFSMTTCVLCRQGFGPTEQEWGYVTVREGAHIFWWLHQTNANVDYTTRPVVVWLQGGPGASSTGYGNFAELGPLDVDLNLRNTTWLNNYNVLFVDNPVGTGFSYVSRLGALTTTNRQIADDFVVLLQGFYQQVPQLLNAPLYIFSQSYGGKMAIEIAVAVNEAIKIGELRINLAGVSLGDPWVSPVDSVLTWGPYLLNLGFVDESGYEAIQNVAEETESLANRGLWEDATTSWLTAEYLILRLTDNIDFYNVLTKISANGRRNSLRHLIRPGFTPVASDDDKIEAIMEQVKETLGLSVSWGEQSNAVFNYLWEDFMKPVTDVVEQVLNTTDIKVVVLNGHLDLIVDTPGTIKWVDALKFDGSLAWKNTARYPIIVDGIVEGHYKRLGNLAMYWVDRGGHMIPADNTAAMKFILEETIK